MALAAHRRVPPPQNDPNLSYRPGSPERTELKSRLEAMSGTAVEIPVIIGGREIRTGQTANGGHAAQARPRAGDVAQGDARPGPPGGGQRARRPARMGQLAVRGSGRRVPPRRRAADDDVAADAERRDDAGPVEDRVPGRDRRGLRAGRLLALQRRVRAGAAGRAADQQPQRLEPDRLPAARGLRLRDHAVQLHRHRRQPFRRAGADGLHGGLEAGGHGDARQLLHLQAARSGGPAAGRHQLRAGRSGGDLEHPAGSSRARRRALHRQHRRLQPHLAPGWPEPRHLPQLPAHRRRDRRQGLHRRPRVGRSAGSGGGRRARRLRVPGAEVLGRQPAVRAEVDVGRRPRPHGRR